MARILTCYYRPKPGGFCKRLFRGINALLAEGHSVHYLAVEPFPITHPNCHFHRFHWPVSRCEGLVFWAVFHFLAPIQLTWLTIRYRIEHAFAFGTTYAFLLQPSRRWLRKPIAVFLRADTLENHRLKQRAPWLLWLEQLLEEAALFENRIWTVSCALEQSIRTRHHRLRMQHLAVLPNEIPDCPVPPRAAADTVICGLVGVLEERKNQLFLLECWQRLPQSARLHIYGTGPSEELLRARAVGLSVAFMGWRAPEEVWSSIDVLLFPSLHEGMPNAVLEAIACDVPVLASDIPPHREILGPANLLPNDRDSWITALSRFLAAPIEESLRLRDSQRSASQHCRFDWDAAFVEATLG